MNLLEQLAQQRQQPIVQIRPLAGLTACSQQVLLANGERYVWREQNERACQLGVNYLQEAELLQAIAPLGFAPQVYLSQAAGSLLHWLSGDVPQQFSDRLLIQLAEKLAALHTFAIPPQAVSSAQHFAKLDLAERCRELWQRLSPEQQKQFPPNLPNPTPFARAFCHHDVHLGNLVEQGDQLYLIDWEYAAVSDPALDVAMFLHANSLSHTQQAVFFERYFAKTRFDPTAFQQKMAEYLPAIVLLNQLWFVLA